MWIEETLAGQNASWREIACRDVPLDASFREACRQNACGFYGRCWTCPPDVGAIDALQARLRSYSRALVLRAAYPLEDALDIDGMRDAARAFNRLICRVRDAISQRCGDCLALGAGACGACARCARADDQPCRNPHEALPSLEGYGVDVSELARRCGLPYGKSGEATYFGLLLMHKEDGGSA